ncbi:MAG: hypothetical protein AB7E45_07870, partial [Candidatus Caldatribacteriota bacterium]
GGRRLEYPKEIARNILTIFGQNIFTGGISTENKFEVYKEYFAGEYRKILIRDNRLVGFVLIGAVGNPGVYLFMLKNQIEVNGKINLLLKGAMTYPVIHPSLRNIIF